MNLKTNKLKHFKCAVLFGTCLRAHWEKNIYSEEKCYFNNQPSSASKSMCVNPLRDKISFEKTVF